MIGRVHSGYRYDVQLYPPSMRFLMYCVGFTFCAGFWLGLGALFLRVPG